MVRGGPIEVHVDEIVRLARPLPTVTRDRVALLGDAAHAMAPDLGQGACQAFEDAATLAAVLQQATGLADALRAYDAQRRPRTTALQRQATRSNRMLSLTGTPALLRDLTLQVIPQQLATSALARQFRFDPGPS